MGKSILGRLINYTKERVPRLRIPKVMFTNPEAVDPEPPRGQEFSEWIVIKCPKCRQKYTVTHYTVDFVCSGEDGTGCPSNRVKYYDEALGRYVDENRNFLFDITTNVRC